MGNDDPFQRMRPEDARDSFPKVSSEATSLEPDALIVLYEIDISEIKNRINLSSGATDITADTLCFHNMEIVRGKKIKFDGKTYYAIPISITGFETTSTGDLPRPRLTIAPMRALNDEDVANPEGSPHHNYTWLALKRTILELDDMIGAKVTRIRTFAKYLDVNPDMPEVGQESDPHAQFPRDTFFIDAKTLEDKNQMEFELTSFADMEGFKLPGRFVLSSRCPFIYRGNGCSYEFKATDASEILEQKELFETIGQLPKWAPPISTDEDKLISDEVPKDPNGDPQYDPNEVNLADVSEYDKNVTYGIGDVVYLEKSKVKYYFVARAAVEYLTPPPNADFWVQDMCSKTMHGCKHRWGIYGKAKNDDGSGAKEVANEFLMFGGFPGTNTRLTI